MYAINWFQVMYMKNGWCFTFCHASNDSPRNALPLCSKLITWATKKNTVLHFLLSIECWLFNTDTYNGFMEKSPYNCVGISSPHRCHRLKTPHLPPSENCRPCQFPWEGWSTVACLSTFTCLHGRSSWWFQPLWKILVKLDHFPK